MPLVIYSYAPLSDLPEGVENRDATEILDESAIFHNQERKSLAPFSDVFRYRMLEKADYYWVDLDAYAVAPYNFASDHVYAWHGQIVAIGILSLPKDSPTLQLLLRYATGQTYHLPWLPLEKRAELQAECERKGGTFDPGILPYKALGPMALTALLHRTKEIRHALPREVFYPTDPRHSLRPVRKRLDQLPETCVSIHLFASVVRRLLRENGWTRPPDGSLIATLLKQDGLNPDDFPSPV